MANRHAEAVAVVAWAVVLLGTSGAAVSLLTLRVMRTGELR